MRLQHSRPQTVSSPQLGTNRSDLDRSFIRALVGGLGAAAFGLGSDRGEKWPKPEQECNLAGWAEQLPWLEQEGVSGEGMEHVCGPARRIPERVLSTYITKKTN